MHLTRVIRFHHFLRHHQNENCFYFTQVLASPKSWRSLSMLAIVTGISRFSSPARWCGMDLRSRMIKSVSLTQKLNHRPSHSHGFNATVRSGPSGSTGISKDKVQLHPSILHFRRKTLHHVTVKRYIGWCEDETCAFDLQTFFLSVLAAKWQFTFFKELVATTRNHV